MRNPPLNEHRNEALERGLAQLRKATELAVGYQPQLVTRAEASAVLDHIEGLEGELERQQEMWSVQSRVISALAAEVPDDVRERVLAPIREATSAS